MMKSISATLIVFATTFATQQCLARPHPGRALKARQLAEPDARSYIPTTSERINIFSALSDDESEQISDFLDAQQNVTLFGEYWPSWVSTLLPNKTDALLYLDEDGPVPDRYARVSLQWDCYTREYMVGPLPIDSSSAQIVPLDWMFNGNATQDDLACISDEETPGYGGLESPYDEEEGWTGEELPGDDKAGPITILPDGPRHKFDPDENFVSWSKIIPSSSRRILTRNSGLRILHQGRRCRLSSLRHSV
jgi:hypothetical protein